MTAVISGGLADQFPEDPVEVSERLKTDFKSDFTDAQIWIEQKVLGFFNADPGKIIGKVDSSGSAEDFAK